LTNVDQARRVFIAGSTGYMGSRLIPLLCERGHHVTALAREESQRKVPPGCAIVTGNALDGASYAATLDSADTFVQLVGVSHPSPAKAQQFIEIDQRSGLEAVRVAAQRNIAHFIYVSVAQPAPAMHAYIAARSACESAIRNSGLNSTIVRPWYVLGPGHRWPYALLPFYKLAEVIPATREGARRLGLITIDQMVLTLLHAVEHPAEGVRFVGVPEIREIARAA
jgi:uncharacterized protein YbjT (DUF2867 family)